MKKFLFHLVASFVFMTVALAGYKLETELTIPPVFFALVAGFAYGSVSVNTRYGRTEFSWKGFASFSLGLLIGGIGAATVALLCVPPTLSFSP